MFFRRSDDVLKWTTERSGKAAKMVGSGLGKRKKGWKDCSSPMFPVVLGPMPVTGCATLWKSKKRRYNLGLVTSGVWNGKLTAWGTWVYCEQAFQRKIMLPPPGKMSPENFGGGNFGRTGPTDNFPGWGNITFFLKCLLTIDPSQTYRP